MSEDIRDVVSELVETYGIKILEDPDRLSQFLEDRCAQQAEESFRLTFALRRLLKSGWRPAAHAGRLTEEEYPLSCQLGFSREESQYVFELINEVQAKLYGRQEELPLPHRQTCKRAQQRDSLELGMVA